MKIFACSSCNQTVFFENVRCTRCGSELAYLPDRGVMSVLETVDDVLVATNPCAKGDRYRLCQNSIDYGVCNWAVPLKDDNAYCFGCRLNNVIPNLSHPGALVAWGRIEHAKKRMLYTLLELGLPVDSHHQKKNGLVFSFLESDKSASPILTGHDEGHITLNIAEADNPGREKLREQLGETYRTLVGHFRHEIGHYYWDVLIRGNDQIGPFRDLFGDPDKSYEAELKRHYEQGPPPDWQNAYVSTYATMHPWEDWAETWAHYMHIVDTLGTARSYGMVLVPEPAGLSKTPRALVVNARKVNTANFDDLIDSWFPLTFALNSLNRGMGLLDAYPFVLSERAITKLRFVHDVIERAHHPAAPTSKADPPVAPGSKVEVPSGPDRTEPVASA